MKGKIIKAVLFNFILALAIIITLICIPKDDAKIKRVYGFKKSENSNLDVIFFGNSDLFNGIIPSVIYDEYGYKTYNSGKSKEKLGEEYEFIKESFKYQKPELIVIDVDNISFGAGSAKKYTGLKGLYNKADMNHDWWRQADPTEIIEMKGYYFGDRIIGYDNGLDYLDTNNDYAGKKTLETIDKIYNLCKKNNTELMLLELPSTTTWSHKRHEIMDNYAKDKGINFIDFNYLYEESKIDLTHDTRDGGDHLNVYGAIKATKYVGKFISLNYDITPSEKNESFEEASKMLENKLGMSFDEAIK